MFDLIRRRKRNVANGIVTKERVVFEKNYVVSLHFSSPEEKLYLRDNLARHRQALDEYLEPLLRLSTGTEYLKLVARNRKGK